MSRRSLFFIFYVLFKYDTLNRSTGKTVNLVNPVDVSYSYYRSQKAYDESGTLIDATLSSSRLEKELIGERCYRMEYDELGNIVKEEYGTRESAQSTVEFTQNVTYEYDARNQLIRENNQLTDQTITYEYDAYGNLLNKTYYAYTTGELKEPGERVVYTYQTEGWKDLLTAYDGETITYDAIGNPLTYRGAALSWEGRELKSYAKDTIAIEYETDYSGKRVQKTVNGVEYSYVYTGDLLTYEKRGEKEFYYSYDGENALSKIRYKDSTKDETYYVLTRANGDVSYLTNEAGEIVAQYSYDAWGNTITVTDRDGNRITDPEHMGNLNLIRYRGYYYDAEMGLYYLNSRYYDPEVGRFISADAVEVITASPMALTDKNLFAYCDNNPVMRTDCNGEFWVTSFFVGVAKQYIGDVIGNVVSGKTGLDIFVPSSSLGQYVASGVTEMIPGSGFRKIVVDNVVTEYFVSSEKYLTGKENSTSDVGKRMIKNMFWDITVSGVKKSIDVELESKAPKNYHSYARKYYNTMPQTARKVIEKNMARELKRNSRIRTGVSFGIDVITKSIR